MRRPEHVLVALVLIAGAALGAWALWPTKVPDDLRLPPLDEREVFDPAQLREAQHFETFLHWNALASMVVVLIVLGLYAWRGHRLARESAAGRIGTGMLLGMLGLGILWITQIPFGLAELWWARRYGVADDVGYIEWLLAYWLSLAGEFGFICLALVIVMGFAQVLRGRWWVAGAPTFVALYVLFSFTYPWLVPADRPMRDPALLSAAREYAREQGTEPIPVRVEEVSSYTDSPNAFAAGMDSSRKVFIWDTLLDGRFADDEVRMVLAHEIAHHSREHIWKGVGLVRDLRGARDVPDRARNAAPRLASRGASGAGCAVRLRRAQHCRAAALQRARPQDGVGSRLGRARDDRGSRRRAAPLRALHGVRARRPVTARVGVRPLRHASRRCWTGSEWPRPGGRGRRAVPIPNPHPPGGAQGSGPVPGSSCRSCDDSSTGAAEPRR